jgi:tetratricopeptide (TPR) repeat protein
MLVSVRRAACAALLLGAGILSMPAFAQDPNSGGLNLQNPYAKPNTPGTTGSKVNEEVTPRNEDYAKAMSLIEDGEYNDAMLVLNKLVAMNPIDADALTQLGFCYEREGQPGKAMSYYKKVIGIKPQHLEANKNAGELLLNMKNLSGAEERLSVLQKACDNCDQYNQLKAKIEVYKLAQQG